MKSGYFSEELMRIVKVYHQKPDEWIRFNWQDIKNLVDQDGAETFIGILELFCKKRMGKLRFFFEDYGGYRQAYLHPESIDDGRRISASHVAPDLLDDMKDCESIRAKGRRYFETDDWQGFKKRIGIGHRKGTEEEFEIPGMEGE